MFISSWPRHQYNLGLSVEELRWLGARGGSEPSGCLTPSFPQADERRGKMERMKSLMKRLKEHLKQYN